MPAIDYLRAPFLAFLAAGLCLSSAQPAQADTFTVGSGETYTTVAAGLAAAGSGDTVLVRAGTYEVSDLRPASGVTLLGEDGPLNTRLYASSGGNAILVEDVDNVRIEGFDIYAEPGVGPLTNGMVYIEDSTNIYIGDCFIHDASDDGDVVKVNSSQDLTIERCIIWNPAERDSSPGTYQECIDIRGHGDARITLRGSWLFHVGTQGDYLLYAKGGTVDLLWENNIFGPSAGDGWGNVPVETGHLVQSDPTQYESERFVVRNNLLVGLKGTAAFAFAGPNVSLLYNNVFYKNENVDRALIELSANPAEAGGPGLGLYSLNNIFFDNGTVPVYRVRDTDTGNNLTRDYNVYETGMTGDDLNLATETNSSFIDDPLFASPSVPTFDPGRGTEQIRSILEGFVTQTGSQARGAGVDVWGVAAAHPTAIAAMSDRTDAFGTSRGASWDAGLYQYSDIPPADGHAPGDPLPTGDALTGGDAAASDSGVSGGCGCTASASAHGLAWLLGVLAVHRRRRPRPE